MAGSCSDDNTLVLGTDEGDLIVKIRPGQPRTFQTYLSEGDNETPIAWPEAPLLVFPDLTVTATLTATEAPLEVVANSMATWVLSAEETETLIDYTTAEVIVAGETWWVGVVRCPS